MVVRSGIVRHLRQSRPVAPGDTIRVSSAGRRADRTAVVVDVRSSESLSAGHVIVVRWQDDQTTAAMSPGANYEVIKRSGSH